MSEDWSCDCFTEHPPLWGPACSEFVPAEPDEFGEVWCLECGHSEKCHGETPCG